MEHFKFRNSIERPARTLDNEVVWINPHFADILPLKVGERDPSIAMLVHDKAVASDTQFEVRSGHWRTGMSPAKSEFSLKDYPYTDQKGIGNFSNSTSETAHPMWEISPFWRSKEIDGLMDLESALYDAQMTEELEKAGVRMGCIISSITRLKEVPIQNKQKKVQIVPVQESNRSWRKKDVRAGIFPSQETPAVMTRHYSWPLRVRDLGQKELNDEERQRIIDASIKKVSEELGREFTYAEYLRWFAETLGINIGRMHRAGYFHRYLHSQNVTADCGIMDNDSVSTLSQVPLKQSREKAQDHFYNIDGIVGKTAGGLAVIRELFAAFSNTPRIAESLSGNVKELEELYEKAYQQTLNKTEEDSLATQEV